MKTLIKFAYLLVILYLPTVAWSQQGYGHGSGSSIFQPVGSDSATTERNLRIGNRLTTYGQVKAIIGGGSGANAISWADDIVYDSNGNMGISFLSPDLNNIHIVFGSPSNKNYALIRGRYNAGSPVLDFFVTTTTEPKFVLDSQGNVGIKTLTPRARLDVDGMIGVTNRDTLASAATLTIGVTSNVIIITGTADIDSFDTASTLPENFEVTLIFNGTAATNGVVDGNNLKLTGNLAYTADDVLKLIRIGNTLVQTAPFTQN